MIGTCNIVIILTLFHAQMNLTDEYKHEIEYVNDSMTIIYW